MGHRRVRAASESSSEEEEDSDDSREVKEDSDIPGSGEPEEPATAAPEPSAEKPSRKEIAPAPTADAEAAPAPDGTDGHSPEVSPTPRIEPVISLVTTSTSDSAGEGAIAATPGGRKTDTSLIETPDRQPEEPDTEDRRFIKPDDEKESVGDDHESDPDYELTDLTEGGSSLPKSEGPGTEAIPPGFEDCETAADEEAPPQETRP